MAEMKMCHDCPHKREHEVGDQIALFVGFGPGPHKCHNNVARACVGHVMQRGKIAAGVVQVEDFTDKIIFDATTGIAKRTGGRDAKREEGAA